MNSRDLNGYGRMSSSDSSSGSNGCSVESPRCSSPVVKVEVTEPVTHTNSKHVLYQMDVTGVDKAWSTVKRYSEFYKLYEQVSRANFLSHCFLLSSTQFSV
jgi:hypothetical protein